MTGAGALLPDHSVRTEGRREIEETNGAGIISILTAEFAEERREKQKCSANLCVLRGFTHYYNYIFQQPCPPLAAPTNTRGHCPHHRTPARSLSQCLAWAGVLLLDHSGRAEGRRERKDAFHVTVILISDVLVSGKNLAWRFECQSLIRSIMHQLFEGV